MVKKQQKKKTTELEVKKKTKKLAINISKTQSSIKSFLDKFKADVAKKKEKYQQYAQESQKKRTP